MTSRRWQLVLSAGLLAAAAGCAGDPPPTYRVIACWGDREPRPETGSVTFTFEQDGQVVATAGGNVDVVVAADVPAGGVTTVLANGQFFGEVGVADSDAPVTVDGGASYAVMGPGCPDASSMQRPTAAE